MKKLISMLAVFACLGFLAMACGTSNTCSPACGSGEVCITEGSAPACKKTCSENSDCGTGEECHKDEGTPHCDKAD